MKKKSILVTGDWVSDWHIGQSEATAEGYFDGEIVPDVFHYPGGAWHVAHLIEEITCKDFATVHTARCSKEAKSKPPENSDSASTDLPCAFSVWKKFPREKGDKKEKEVWRIDHFLGATKTTSPWEPNKKQNDKVKCFIPNATLPCQTPCGSSPCKIPNGQFDLIVIDDMDLGFASPGSKALDHVLQLLKDGGNIVLKQGKRGVNGEGTLMKLLRDKKDWVDRLHVVVPADALRQRNASIPMALSWDQLLEDVEREFSTGPSSRDLAKVHRAVVYFGLAGAAAFKEGKLEKFVFLPRELEETWQEKHPGRSFGLGSVLTASLVRHVLQPDSYPLYFAITQALAAQRIAHEEGGGSDPRLNVGFAFFGKKDSKTPSKTLPSAPPAAKCLRPPLKGESGLDDHLACIKPFRAAWNPKNLNVWEGIPDGSDPEILERHRLLCNVAGTAPESFQALATEIVIHGVDKALASVPMAVYKDYRTVDRDEIENLSMLDRLIRDYCKNPKDKRPLSIAVFGQPGSGKSFAIKQIGEELCGESRPFLEFNLTQFENSKDLHRAFHQVRDLSIKAEIPIVFWDEFDAGNMKWLTDFLVPMQDAEFFDGSHKHPFGKCIFVFAGATCSTFEEFGEWKSEDSENAHPNGPRSSNSYSKSFKEVKGPDFISRLRGFLNVKSPNPERRREPSEATHAESVKKDPAYVLRRAMILRSDIERNFSSLINPQTKRARIALNVIQALLLVKEYKHGARSINAILAMSSIGSARRFTASALPPQDLLALHISDDFPYIIKTPIYADDLLEKLAIAGFEGWKAMKKRQGYKHGKTRNDKKGYRTHPDIVKWDKLSKEKKNDNLDPVPHRILGLRLLGYNIVLMNTNILKLKQKEKEILINRAMKYEHGIWLSDHLSTGWEKGKPTQDHLRIHTDIAEFNKIEDSQKELNRGIMERTIKALEANGYTLEKIEPEPTATP